MRSITKHDVNRAMKPYIWDFSNQVLYDLCRNYPKHDIREHVLAKVSIIGRVYAAAIERRPKTNNIDFGSDFYQSVVWPKMQSAKIDKWFAPLKRNRNPGSDESIRIHKRLHDLFSEIAETTKRSLASKYLHFHFPDIFYLYDSRAKWAIGKLAPRLRRELSRPDMDPVYRAFVGKCTWVRDHIKEKHGVWFSPRQVDRLLLKIADDERKRTPAEFRVMLTKVRQQARKAGMKKSDIKSAILKVRSHSR